MKVITKTKRGLTNYVHTKSEGLHKSKETGAGRWEEVGETKGG